MKTRRKRIWRGAVLALAVAGIAAPAAQGRPFLNSWGKVVTTSTPSNQQISTRPDDKSGVRGVGFQPVIGPDLIERKVAVLQMEQAATNRPDNRAGVRGPGVVETQTPQLVTLNSDRFDWKDAGIGAGTAFGASIVLISALMVSRRRQAHVAV